MEMKRRLRAGYVVIAGFLAMGSGGCSGPPVAGSGALDLERLPLATTEEQALLPFCSGAWGAPGRMVLPSLGREVLGYPCLVPDGAPRLVWVDQSTGELTEDLDGLLNKDSLSFKADHDSLDPALEQALSKAGPADRFVADVWFHVEEVLLDKDSTTDSEIVMEKAAHEARLRAAVAALVARFSELGEGWRLLSDLRASEIVAPRVRVEATSSALHAIGRFEEVRWILPDIGPLTAGTSAYFDNVNAAWLDNGGYDGGGRIVGILENARPDSTVNLPGYIAGSCTPTSGPAHKCHCPAGPTDSHPRVTTGLIRNSVIANGADGLGGLADAASWISGNLYGGCTSNGPDTFTSAVNWMLANGASVISTSVGTTAGNPQNPADVLLDYAAIHSPYPFIAGLAHNGGNGVRSSWNFYNGLVVGGSDDHGTWDRTQSTMHTGTQAANYLGSSGLEVPHLVAPAMNIDLPGAAAGTIVVSDGTSLSTPIVAGIAASIQEFNPSMSNRPEAMIPGLLASSDQNVHGVWPLDLFDQFDDYDGTGLVNALWARLILDPQKKVNGGNVAVAYGHDYGLVTSAYTPAGTYYAETYNALVPAGQRLRVADIFLAGSSLVRTGMQIYDGASLVFSAGNYNQGYQYATQKNTSAVTKTYTIKIFLSSWGTNTSTYYGIAWAVQ